MVLIVRMCVRNWSVAIVISVLAFKTVIRNAAAAMIVLALLLLLHVISCVRRMVVAKVCQLRLFQILIARLCARANLVTLMALKEIVRTAAAAKGLVLHVIKCVRMVVIKEVGYLRINFLLVPLCAMAIIFTMKALKKVLRTPAAAAMFR